MKCRGCNKTIPHYLQIKEVVPIDGWFESHTFAIQACEECVPDHDGVWEGEE